MAKVESQTGFKFKKEKTRHLSTWFLAGAAIGSALTYFLDPERGNYRRAKLRDRTFKFKKDSTEYSAKMFRHLRNQAQGLKCWAAGLFSKEEIVDDQILEARVRSNFGRKVSHAKSVKASVINGVVTLSGPILAKEVNNLISCAKNVSGVKKVVNKLDVHETAENIPDLQGEGPEYLRSRSQLH